MASRIGMVQRRVIGLMRTLPENKITPVKLSMDSIGVSRNWTPSAARAILKEMKNSGFVYENERDDYRLNDEYI